MNSAPVRMLHMSPVVRLQERGSEGRGGGEREEGREGGREGGKGRVRKKEG